MVKRRAGKQKVKKAVVRKPAARKASNPLPMSQVVSSAPAVTYPHKVLVKKGDERIPVEVTDAAHRARLVEEFGESSLEVLP